MKLSTTLLLLLWGLACPHEGGAMKTPLGSSMQKTSSSGRTQESYAEEFQMRMEEIEKAHTRDDLPDPEFYSEIFNSTIIGKNMETIKGRSIYAFQGFRFAEAPTKETRFKPLAGVRKYWDGDSVTVNHIGSKCNQYSMIGHNPSGDEDCLFLNVYTPYLPGNETEPLPVMFFIHGGSFTTGDTSMYLPTKLLDHDVILVTIHYRLGAFGFFTLDNEDAPGNAALYDMVEALAWTQDCISDFGGDPDKVTIFGESAGSVSINYMMLVEPARGMFRGAIAESGSCLDHWALDEDPLDATYYIANYLECDMTSDDTIYECVSSADADDLVYAMSDLVSHDRHLGLIGFRGCSPTIQTSTLPENATYELLVTQHPIEYFRERNFAQVPFMTGANKQEGSFVIGIMYGDYLEYYGLKDNATYMKEQMVQDIVQAINVEDDTYSISESLTFQYCEGVDMADFDAAVPCLIDMAGVLFLKAGSLEVSHLHSYYSDENTYYYSFEFESDDTMYPFLLGDAPFDTGVTHSDELMYIFSMPAIMDTPEQVKTMDRMTKMWTNFAIYGDPTPDEEQASLDELGLPKWSPFLFDEHHYLLMQNDFTVGAEFTDRWRISMDDLGLGAGATPDPNECTGACLDIRDQRDAYEITMIVFIVACCVATLAAAYFFFKARN